MECLLNMFDYILLPFCPHYYKENLMQTLILNEQTSIKNWQQFLLNIFLILLFLHYFLNKIFFLYLNNHITHVPQIFDVVCFIGNSHT